MTEIVTEWVKLPDVTVNVPVVAELPALNVNVLVVVEGFGLNEAVTPVGKVDVENVTLLLKPFVGLTACSISLKRFYRVPSPPRR